MDSGKRSVLISVVGILAAIGLMVGAGFWIARSIRDSVGRIERPRAERQIDDAATADPATETLATADLRDFTGIYTAGGWTVNVSAGEVHSVRVDGSEKALEQVEVFQRGDTLHLELKSGIRSVTGKLTATVVVPDLERLEADGGVSINLTGFNLDSLEVEVDGAASLTARDGSIGDLSLDSAGAASFDFSRIKVKNAEVEMDGASDLDIWMDGGDLTGVLRGVGNVSFSGDVADESIRVEGLGRVRRD